MEFNSKVALGKGNGLLAWVTVLGNEVAGVAGEHEVVNGTLGSLARLDHFRDATKMIGSVVTR